MGLLKIGYMLLKLLIYWNDNKVLYYLFIYIYVFSSVYIENFNLLKSIVFVYIFVSYVVYKIKVFIRICFVSVF